MKVISNLRFLHLGALSHHVKWPSTQRPPCWEEAQASQGEWPCGKVGTNQSQDIRGPSQAISGLDQTQTRMKTFWTASPSQATPIHNFFFFFCLFVISRAAPVAYGGSQAISLIRAVAIGLCQSHRSEPRLQPTSQLTAMPDP